MKNSINSYSGRVEYYSKFRPSYPEQIISLLEDEINFESSKDIADIASGTGILSRLFLNNGNLVFGIEPNDEMRTKAEKELKNFINFISINGTAENTTMADHSVDMITVGQAFHWFDLKKTKKEFKRLLREDGDVVIIWNEPKLSTPLMAELDALMKSLDDNYNQADKDNIDSRILSTFYDVSKLSTSTFHNSQMLDLNGLKGRMMSVDFVPAEGDKNKKLMKELKSIFEKYNNGNMVKLEYNTRVYWGKLK